MNYGKEQQEVSVVQWGIEPHRNKFPVPRPVLKVMVLTGYNPYFHSKGRMHPTYSFS